MLRHPLLLLALCWTAAGAAEPGRFAVELTSTAGANEGLVSVMEVADGQRKLLWSRNFPWLGAQAQQFGYMASLVKKHVSADGQFVVLRWSYIFDSNSGWMFVPRQGEIVRASIRDIEKLVGASIAPSGGFAPGPAGLLEFMDEAPPLYHAWFPTPNKWMTVDLRNPKPALADAAATSALNSRAREIAFARVHDHQPSGLGRLLKPLRQKVTETLPGFNPTPQPSLMNNEELLGSYAFLAVHKEPEAEAYIRNLLTFKMPSISPGYYFIEDSSVTMAMRSAERVVGDTLWDWWLKATNGQPGLSLTPPSTWTRDSEKLKHLASVRGELKLPIPLPQKDEGRLWLYLLPDAVPKGDWLDHPDVAAIAGAPLGRFPSQSPIERVRFHFSTLAPGRYRLKAVWDRRLPFAQPGHRAAPGPGDYESAESAPFILAAGQALEGIALACTNTLGGADEYYAADQAWARVAPSRLDEEQRGQIRDRLGVGQGFVHETPLITNMVDGFPPLRLVRAAQVASGGGIAPVFELAYILNREHVQFGLDVELRDQHGCTFRTTVRPAPSAGQSFTTYLARFAASPLLGPFQAIARTSYEGWNIPATTNLFDLSGRASEALVIAPETVPARKTAGPLIVELAGLHRSHAVEFRLKNADGAPAEGWIHESTTILDRLGQPADHFSKFCRQEELFRVIATFAPARHSPAEHTWRLPVQEWPGEGEFALLNASNMLDDVAFQVLAIGGKGSFSYRHGRVIEFSPELAGWDDSAWPPLKNVSDFVRLRPANHFDPVHRDDLVVRLPHVALRIEGLRPEHRFRVVEERERPWRSLADLSDKLPRTEPWYLPLNRETRKQTGGLTIELARAVTVGFDLRLPPEPHAGAPK